MHNSKLFVLIFAAGSIVWYGTGPYHMVVPARASIEEYRLTRDAFLANEKTCYICDMQ